METSEQSGSAGQVGAVRGIKGLCKHCRVNHLAMGLINAANPDSQTAEQNQSRRKAFLFLLV